MVVIENTQFEARTKSRCQRPMGSGAIVGSSPKGPLIVAAAERQSSCALGSKLGGSVVGVIASHLSQFIVGVALALADGRLLVCTRVQAAATTPAVTLVSEFGVGSATPAPLRSPVIRL